MAESTATDECMCVCACVRVHVCVLYLTASCGVVTPVSSLTPVTGGSLCVGRAGTLTALRVTVPSSVITGACWEKRDQPIRGETITQQQSDEASLPVQLLMSAP